METKTAYQVSYGGVRLIVRHIGETLIQITPKSPGRDAWNVAEVVIAPPDKNEKSGNVVKVNGENYSFPYNGGAKLREALQEIFLVWRENPDRDSVYRVVSGKTFHCAMCGADLTDDLSTSRGIGPECWKKIYRPESKTAVRESRKKGA